MLVKLNPVFFAEAMDPKDMTEGNLCISMGCGIAKHYCCCGCGSLVVTPLSPHDWQLLFDGETASLSPSIGNWQMECQAHYWIWRNRIIPAGRMSDDEIRRGREYYQRLRNGGCAPVDHPHGLWPITPDDSMLSGGNSSMLSTDQKDSGISKGKQAATPGKSRMGMLHRTCSRIKTWTMHLLKR